MIQSLTFKVSDGEMLASFKMPYGGVFTHALVRFDTKPTSTTRVMLTHVNDDDSDYNVELWSVNPAGGSQDVHHFVELDVPLPLRANESVQLSYANPDDRRVAVTLKGSDSLKL